MSETSSHQGSLRRALVTGASAGIGKAFAERLAREQYDLCLVARSGEKLEALAAGLRESRGVHVEVLAADLSQEAALRQVAERLAEAPPDLLVNNAGIATIGPFAELDAEGEEQQIRLNVLALSRLTRAALPGMIRRGRGAIINVSSLLGLVPGAYTATYSGSKAFVTTFTESLFEELRGTGVRVQVLLPGFTRTEFQDRAGINASQLPGFAWMAPDAVVEASLDALRRGELICVPGFGNRLLGIVERKAPRALVRNVWARLVRRTLD